MDDGYPLLATPNIKSGDIDFEDVNRIPPWRYDESPELQLHVGDVLLAKDGNTLGITNVVTHLPEQVTVNGSIAVIRPHAIEARFLRYWLASEYTQSAIAALKGGMGVPHLFQWDINRLPVLLPNLEEQRRIADFLDAETARLDALIHGVGNQVHLAAARLQALVVQRTWFGLEDRALPLRRYIKRIQTGGTPPTDGRDYSADDGVGWLSPGSIHNSLFIGEPARVLDPAAIADRVVPRFDADSVVVVGIGATAGRVGHLRDAATGNQQLTAVTTAPRLSARFLAWQLWSRTEELRGLAPYTTLPIISNDYLKNVLVRVPSLSQQHEIVAEIDTAANRTDELSRRRERAAALLGERRQALITAAVTGQLNVITAPRSETRAKGVT